MDIRIELMERRKLRSREAGERTDIELTILYDSTYNSVRFPRPMEGASHGYKRYLRSTYLARPMYAAVGLERLMEDMLYTAKTNFHKRRGRAARFADYYNEIATMLMNFKDTVFDVIAQRVKRKYYVSKKRAERTRKALRRYQLDLKKILLLCSERDEDELTPVPEWNLGFMETVKHEPMHYREMWLENMRPKR